MIIRKSALGGLPILLFLAVLLLLPPTAAAADDTAGSALDPLVSQGWVDSYLEEQFTTLKEELAQLRKQLIRTEIILNIDSTAYTVNGKAKTMDIQPYVNSDNRTLVPIRFVAEALGCQVDWTTKSDGRTDQVIISSTQIELILTIGSSSYTVNGKSKTMDTAPVISSGRTMVPIRFVAEAMGCVVDWSPKDAKVEKVYIYQ